MARRRLPKVVFDYLDGGAEGEVTLRENCRVFDDVIFRPRQAVAIGKCNLSTRVLGQDIAFPAMLAPVGYSRLMHPDGEVAAAQAAGEFGTGYILSTISGHKLENVKAASRGPVWYQLYLVGGRGAAERAIERMRVAGFSALVVTIDTAMAGMRERDPRNGIKELLGGSLLAKIPFVPRILARPGWLISFLLDGGVPKLENVVLENNQSMPLIDVTAALAASVVEWRDLQWLRKAWPGPILVKGVLTGEDARRAVDEGVAGVIVSSSTRRRRRGSDIVKAICLGARAVLIGRGYAYGLGAAGHAGVTRALTILWDDVERTLRLLGCASVAELNSSFVDFPANWRR